MILPPAGGSGGKGVVETTRINTPLCKKIFSRGLSQAPAFGIREGRTSGNPLRQTKRLLGAATRKDRASGRQDRIHRDTGGCRLELTQGPVRADQRDTTPAQGSVRAPDDPGFYQLN